MKFITFRYQNAETAGILSPCGKYAIPFSAFSLPYSSLLSFIKEATAEERNLLQSLIPADETLIPLEQITLLSPIPRPEQDIICLGINYMAHAEESARYSKETFGGERPFAVYFAKRVNEAVAPDGFIQGHFDLTERLDYEAELAVVLGQDCRDIAPEDVASVIFGYTILNDVSARELQSRHKQWYFGKSLDGFTPIGPCIASQDSFSFPPKVRIQSRVNGEPRQDSVTSLLIFGIDHIISELSRGMTLRAGTIITTGTPAGVGMGFEPPRFLKKGDVVECEIEGIGVLKNTVGE